MRYDSLLDSNELSARIDREQKAAEKAKCVSAKHAHLGLVEQYKRKLNIIANIDASTDSSIK